MLQPRIGGMKLFTPSGTAVWPQNFNPTVAASNLFAHATPVSTTASGTTDVFTNTVWRGMSLSWNVASVSAATAPSLLLRVQEYDTAAGTYTTLFTSATVTAKSTQLIALYPGIGGTTNTAAYAATNTVIGRELRVSVLHENDGDAWYSILRTWLP